MMNDRERRDFNAGLSEEVDAWFRGDTSRREFLTRLVLMGGAVAARPAVPAESAPAVKEGILA